MSNWEDTMMADKELMAILEQHGYTSEKMAIVRKAQAELSFRAGYEQSVLDNDNWARDGYGYKLGIREMAEWIPELIQGIKDNMWDDDWGVKGVIYEGMLDTLVKGLVKAKLKDLGIDEEA